jgi:hypothetical protein
VATYAHLSPTSVPLIPIDGFITRSGKPARRGLAQLATCPTASAGGETLETSNPPQEFMAAVTAARDFE